MAQHKGTPVLLSDLVANMRDEWINYRLTNEQKVRFNLGECDFIVGYFIEADEMIQSY